MNFKNANYFYKILLKVEILPAITFRVYWLSFTSFDLQ